MKIYQFRIALFLAVLVSSGESQFGQAPSPAIQWNLSEWRNTFVDGTYISQDQSGEDWWYSVKNYNNTAGVQQGYVVCGYSIYNVSSVSTDPLYWGKVSSFIAPGCFNYQAQTLSGSGSPFTNIICDQFETANNRKALVFGKIAMKDLKGNTQWINTYNNGELVNVIQVSDGFIAIGGNANIKSLAHGNNLLPYNPTSTSNTTYFDCATANSNGIPHVYVVKTDFNGNILWENLYGSVPSNTSNGFNNVPAYFNSGEGLNLVQVSNLNIVCVGSLTSLPNASSTNMLGPAPTFNTQGFAFEIDPGTEFIVNNHTFLFPNYPVHSAISINSVLAPYANEYLGVCEATPGNYVFCGREFLRPFGTGAIDYTEWNKGIVTCLNSSFQLNAGWGSNNPTFIYSAGNLDPNAPANAGLYNNPPKYNSNCMECEQS